MSGVSHAEWDALLTPGNAPLSHGYVSAWQHAELPNFEWRAILAHDSDRVLRAAAPAYFYDLDAGVVQDLPRPLQIMRRQFPRLFRMRVYEIGSPVSMCNPLLAAGNVDRRAAAKAILETATREADAEGAAMTIVQNFCDGEHDPACDAIRELGFSRLPVPSSVVLDLPFDSFDDYLLAMRAPYRRRVRRVLEQSQHLTVERLHDFTDLAPELARLVRLVYERAQEVRRETLPPAFFSAVARLDSTSALLLRRPDGSIASSALLQFDGDWLHFHTCGFEQAAGVDEAAYFRLLYEIVRTGIELDARRIDLGITTLAPKFDLGGRPVPLFAWIRHRHALAQRLFAKLAGTIFAPPAAKPRRVFKD